jgi:hypothetical protein
LQLSSDRSSWSFDMYIDCLRETSILLINGFTWQVKWLVIANEIQVAFAVFKTHGGYSEDADGYYIHNLNVYTMMIDPTFGVWKIKNNRLCIVGHGSISTMDAKKESIVYLVYGVGSAKLSMPIIEHATKLHCNYRYLHIIRHSGSDASMVMRIVGSLFGIQYPFDSLDVFYNRVKISCNTGRKVFIIGFSLGGSVVDRLWADHADLHSFENLYVVTLGSASITQTSAHTRRLNLINDGDVVIRKLYKNLPDVVTLTNPPASEAVEWDVVSSRFITTLVVWHEGTSWADRLSYKLFGSPKEWQIHLQYNAILTNILENESIDYLKQFYMTPDVESA